MRGWLLSIGSLALCAALLVGCGSDDSSSGTGPLADAGTDGDSGGSIDTDAAASEGGADGGADAAPWPEDEPVYGIHQLYGDEYQDFRQQMGQSLEQYWHFVDEHVSRLKVSYSRTDTLLVWAFVEPVLGAGYQWDNAMKTDGVIRAAYAPSDGKRMQLVLVLDPTRGGFGAHPYPTGQEAAYQAFVKAAVERYDGDGQGDLDPSVKVNTWQLMGEPYLNLDQGTMTEEEYAQLVRLTEAAVHQADPSAHLVLGDLGPHATQVITKLGDGHYFDAVQTHFWSQSKDYLSPAIADLRSALTSHGYGQAAIWMGQLGTYAGTPGALPQQSAEVQASWLIKAMVANRAAGVQRISWNNLVGWSRYQGDASSWFNYMGLISSGASSGEDSSQLGKERPAYFSYLKLIAETETDHAQLLGKVDNVPAPAKAFRFRPRQGEQPFYIAWADSGQTTFALGWTGASAHLTALVPDAQGTFAQSALEASDGTITVPVSERPVLIAP